MSAKYRCADGSDVESFTTVLQDVEYPAPPAEANKYMNKNKTLFGSLTAGCRGEIISRVAEKHAKLAGTLEGYGPKGGPYDIPKIQSDTVAFKVYCSQ